MKAKYKPKPKKSKEKDLSYLEVPIDYKKEPWRNPERIVPNGIETANGPMLTGFEKPMYITDEGNVAPIPSEEVYKPVRDKNGVILKAKHILATKKDTFAADSQVRQDATFVKAKLKTIKRK